MSALADAAVAIELVPLACPTVIADGRYGLRELIGLGKRAWTYKGVDLHMSTEGHDAEVVVKVYRHEVGEEQESLFARRIAHPNVVRMLDRGRCEDGKCFAVMEYLSGGRLTSLAPMEARRAALTLRDIARGVQAAHDKGVIHADIKPDNVLLGADAVAKLADFDLACEASSAGREQRGTLSFMAPEVFAGEPGCMTPAADVYSLGGVLHFLLCGEGPHGASKLDCECHFNGLRTASRLSCSTTLRLICERALAKSRLDRYRSAGELADDIDSWLGHHPIGWLRPSLPRTAGLWAQRHPKAFASIVIGTLSVTGLLIGRFEWNRQRQIQQAAMQERALVIAEEKLEEVKKLARTQIEGVFDSTLSLSPSEIALPAVVWAHWFGTSPLISTDGRLMSSEAQIDCLEKFIEAAQTHGTARGMHVASARFALGQLLLLNNQAGAAQEQFNMLINGWAAQLDPADNWLLQCHVLRDCSIALQSAPPDRANWVIKLERYLFDAEVGTLGEGVSNLVRTTCERLRGRALPTPRSARLGR